MLTKCGVLLCSPAVHNKVLPSLSPFWTAARCFCVPSSLLLVPDTCTVTSLNPTTKLSDNGCLSVWYFLKIAGTSLSTWKIYVDLKLFKFLKCLINLTLKYFILVVVPKFQRTVVGLIQIKNYDLLCCIHSHWSTPLFETWHSHLIYLLSKAFSPALGPIQPPV